jgi:hypothetical protein
MNPTIATSILAQRQRELLATAEHYRRVRRSARTPRARKTKPDATVRGDPRLGFQTWLTAGRL